MKLFLASAVALALLAPSTQVFADAEQRVRDRAEQVPRERARDARERAEGLRRGAPDAPEVEPAAPAEVQPELEAELPGAASRERELERERERLREQPARDGVRGPDTSKHPEAGKGSERGQQQREERSRKWWHFGRDD